LVILNKTTGASTIVKKSCFDNGSAEEKYCELLRNDLTDAKVNGDDENVALSKSLQLMMIHQGYLFYLARTKDAGNTDSDVRLFRYKISDGSLAHLDDIPLNPKLVAYTDNAFILTGNLGSGTPATAILRISSDGGDTFNYVNINQSSVDYELEMVSDFHQIGNEVFIKGRKNTGVYYDLFKIDLDTILTNPITAVVKMNETHSINATAATAASLALLKTENGLGLIKKDEEYKVYNTNTHVFDSVLQTTLSASKFNGDTYIIAGSNYYVYDTNGTLKETESLVGYNTFCSNLPDQVFLTKNLIVQHCGTSDMGIHLRSNKSFIDLAALGYNWSTNETRMKVLYEDTKRTIISIERAYSSNPTYYDSKIIEIEADSAVLNFLVNKTGETQDNFKYPVAEGSYLRCENTGSGYNNLVYYDLKNGTVDEIDNTYECINDGSFRELTKTFDNGKSFNILLRKIGIESTKGWELYNVKI
jgi:hypothetical protein